MPVLSRFYGIIIRMYFQQAEHNPPHIHALYGEDMAAIDIQTGKVLEGHLPPRALAMVREWAALFTRLIFCICGRHRNSSTFLPLNKELMLCFTRSKRFMHSRTIA